MNKNKITLTIRAAIFGSAVLASPLYAAEQESEQPQNDNQEANQTDEKIVITGSRIRRDSFSVATPLATMDREAIQDTGNGSLSEILIDELPQLSEGFTNANSQSSVQNTGLSTIDLRELGVNRTLTLIDGRRVVSNSYSGNYVSISTIPAGMVERVEIITGGASAVYGSDAIAGVVNIITQKDKEGFNFKARHGVSDEGGARELGLDLDYGTSFNNGKGYAFFSTSYDRDFGLTFHDRERAQIEDAWDYDDDEMCNLMQTNDGDQCMRDITMADWRNRSDSIPGGVFDERSSTRPDAGYWYNSDGFQGNTWWEEEYGINHLQFVMLRIPDEKGSIAGKFDYELTDDLMFYGQVQYSHNRSINNKAPESEDECDSIIVRDPVTGEFGEDCIGRIPRENPFIHQEIFDNARSGDLRWDRNFAEVGNIITDNTRTTIRTWAGLQGSAFDGDWEWDLSVGFGKFKQEQDRQNELYVANVRNALDVVDDGNGGYMCADPDAVADGCVPLNLFGVGSISAAAADYIRANPSITTNIKQTTILGYMTGDLFEMPAGPVASAFGFEYRKDSQDLETNVPNGGVTFNYVPTFSGDVSVSEVFAEAAFPLLRGVSGAEQLTAELSARFADYSFSGTGMVSSYKAGLIWEPVTGYALRANWARAQRAPTITELLSPQRGDYDGFDDICDGVTATSVGQVDDNCRADPGIAATIAAEGEFEDDNNGYSPNVGNSDLFEETADTYTVGITMAPSFLEDFRIAIDYYDITIDDAISSFSNEDIIEYCYDSSLAFGPDNTFCNDISRDEEGQINGIMQRLYNVDSIATSGFDVAAEYRYDFDKYGYVRFKADYTHVLDYTETVQSPDGPSTTNYEGYLSTDIFEDKASASMTWYHNDWRVRWGIKFKGKIDASLSRYEDWLDDMSDNDERCAEADPVAAGCITNPEPLAFFHLPSYIRHDLSVSYTVDASDGGEYRFFGGVNNITDDNGPFIIGGRGNYDSNYGGGKGRFFYVGFQIKH